MQRLILAKPDGDGDKFQKISKTTLSEKSAAKFTAEMRPDTTSLNAVKVVRFEVEAYLYCHLYSKPHTSKVDKSWLVWCKENVLPVWFRESLGGRVYPQVDEVPFLQEHGTSGARLPVEETPTRYPSVG